ncbi:MAG TPA: zf-TFIIB domain-containing protein [Candidimonas sp.]|nr:zf-TFIIB domain-containing protein [Candidimonas sp.]
MKCPHCNDAVLVMSERQGVEIDYCPQCRGVWLDRGELDKLIEKSVAAAPASPPPYQQQQGRPDFADSGHYHHQPSYGKRKQKSWLSEIFD